MTAPAPTPPLTQAQQLLAQRIDDALPQTQCTRCGYPDCTHYAQAVATGQAPINQCPPGGAEGIARLAAITGQPVIALNPDHGDEAPRTLAWIDENWCIGCTLCLDACPTDAIVGSNKRMHTVIEPHCTGCELCIPVCPVDCIQLEPASGSATGWAAWSAPEAAHARQRYHSRQQRLAQAALAKREAAPSAPATTETARPADSPDARAAKIAAAMARARQQRKPPPASKA